METILLVILAFVLMGAGLLGTILPVLPGIPIAWAGFFIYALGTDFAAISLTTALIFLGLTILAILFDFLAPVVGAKKYKASKKGIVGASLGLLIGVIFFPPFGIVIGPFLGAFVGEFMENRNSERAFKSATGAFLGFLFGSLFEIILILVMLGFLIASFF